MARIDKYDPVDGGFRAPLNAAYTGASAPIGVGLNSSGRVVVGAGQTGIVGVICCPYDKAAGDIVDVMTDGELVEFGGTAGTIYYAHATTGAISTSASAYRVGTTVEADRLVVRMSAISPTDVIGDQAAVTHFTNSTGVAGNNTVEDVPAAVAASGDATAASLASTNTALTAIENNIADLTDKVNVILTRLESAGLLTP